jgi:hypothetical protein
MLSIVLCLSIFHTLLETVQEHIQSRYLCYYILQAPDLSKKLHTTQYI